MAKINPWPVSHVSRSSPNWEGQPTARRGGWPPADLADGDRGSREGFRFRRGQVTVEGGASEPGGGGNLGDGVPGPAQLDGVDELGIIGGWRYGPYTGTAMMPQGGSLQLYVRPRRCAARAETPVSQP